MYKRCTKEGIDDGKFWCPTVEGVSEYKNDSKTWGFCHENCPRHEGHFLSLEIILKYFYNFKQH
jgi:hypothetical protein